MNEPAVSGCDFMTVGKVSEVLGVSENTIRRSLNELFPDLAKNGKVTLLDEKQVTAVKMNLRKNSRVAAQPKTDLEKKLIVAQAIQFLQEEIEELRSQNAELKPKAETLDKITATASDVSVRELAAVLALPRLGQNNLFLRLREDGYIDGFNRPYRQYIENGLMYEKEYYVAGLNTTKTQLRITQKGVAYFAKKYAEAAA
jgi:phage antirepressor YoqD-like protein